MKGQYAEAVDLASLARHQQDIQASVVQAAAQAGLGRLDEASASIENARAMDPRFARDPMGLLRHYFIGEELVARLAQKLRAAGLETG